MKYLINKTTGVYAKVIKWTGDLEAVDNALGNNNRIDYNLSMDDKHRTLFIHPTELSFDDFEDSVYPLNSYVIYTNNIKKGTLPIFRGSDKYIQKHYIKPVKANPLHVINDKTGKHYTAYYYNGTFTTLPKGFSEYHRLRINDKKQLVEDISVFNIFFAEDLKKAKPNWKIQANKGDYLLVRDDGCGLQENTPIKNISASKFYHDFSKPKPVKLPKEIFVVVSDVGEYSDREVKNIKAFASYTDAVKYANQNDDWYVDPIRTGK